MTECGLRGIRYRLGEPREIDELPELVADPGLLEVFKLRGLARYAAAATGPTEAGRAVLGDSLAAAAIDPGSVDVVVYGTDLVADALFTQEGMNDVLLTCGLDRAYPLGVSLSGCNGVASVLDIASSLVRAGTARRVACLVIGQLAHGVSRLMDLSMSVLSDAAVACVVTDEPGELRLLRVGRANLPEIGRLSIVTQTQAYFAATARTLQIAVDEALAPLAMTRSDLSRVLTNNYARHIQQAFLRHAGFRADQSWLGNLSRFAHAFSADTLINLADCIAAGELAPAQRCLLLGTSPSSCGAVVVEMN